MIENEIFIGNRVIDCRSKVFVTAEIGTNHGGSLSQARKLIDAAAEGGADAVKLQSFRVDRLMVSSRDRHAEEGDAGESVDQMLRRLELSWPEQERLKKHADEAGIVFLSTPSDEENVDFLDSIGVPAFKIASSDITHFPLLRHVASKGKPVFLSTGMSYLSEVADAVWNLRYAGAKEILLMHCVSAFPAPARHMNLRALQTLNSYFELPVGLSDHSEGIHIALAAVALGVVLIEKHFTMDKNACGPEHKASMDPSDLKLLVRNLRDVEASLGDGRKRPASIEEEIKLLSRRSIVAGVDMRAGETIAPWMLTCKRPGSGLEPRHLDKVAGMRVRRNIGKDTVLQWDDLVLPASHDSVLGDQDELVASAGSCPVKKRPA